MFLNKDWWEFIFWQVQEAKDLLIEGMLGAAEALIPLVGTTI
jgi:hypothetical protein